jgi:hypothetical protein
MKNDPLTTFLNFALAVLVFASVGFALLAILREPKVPAYTAAAMQDKNTIMKVNAVIADTINYNASVRSPELTSILHSLQAKPATPAH